MTIRILSVLLLAFAALTSSASAQSAFEPGKRRVFQALSTTTIDVLGSDGKLWRERTGANGKFGQVPPPRDSLFNADLSGRVGNFVDSPSGPWLMTERGFLWNGGQGVGFTGFVYDAQPLPNSNDVAFLRSNGQLLALRGWPHGKTIGLGFDVGAFQVLSANAVLGLQRDGRLWLTQGPIATGGSLVQDTIDNNVQSFWALSTTTVAVLGRDRKLWLELASAGRFTHVPPSRYLIDENVTTFQPLDTQTVAVLGTDGKLWLEHFPFGHVPPVRELVDASVLAFQAISKTEFAVLGTDRKLWLEHAGSNGRFGQVPPKREQIDSAVAFPGDDPWTTPCCQ